MVEPADRDSVAQIDRWPALSRRVQPARELLPHDEPLRVDGLDPLAAFRNWSEPSLCLLLLDTFVPLDTPTAHYSDVLAFAVLCWFGWTRPAGFNARSRWRTFRLLSLPATVTLITYGGRRIGQFELKMKASASPTLKDPSNSQLIDARIEALGDWRGKTLSQLRALIKKADARLVEEVKWKKPSNPMGVPVWSDNGIVCIGEALKNTVRLTFPKGASMKGSKDFFNARLDSNSVRAIDFHEGDVVDEAALKAVVLEAVRLNTFKARKS